MATLAVATRPPGKGEILPAPRTCCNELPAGGAGNGDAGRRQLGHQCDRIAAVVAEAGIAKGVRLGEVVGQSNGVKERTLRVGGVLGGQREDRLEAAGAASRDDQDAEAIGIIAVLKKVVEPDLLLPRVGVLLRPHALGAPVKLDEKVELLAAGRVQFKGAVGAKKNVGADTKLERVLAVEVRQSDGAPMGGDERMDDEVGQAVRVVMVRDRTLRRSAAWRAERRARRGGVESRGA